MNYKYRTISIEVEAFQMTAARRTDHSDWPPWMHGAWNMDRGEPGSLFPTVPGEGGTGNLSIATLSGEFNLVEFGHWIVCRQGLLYSCSPAVFTLGYEVDPS